MLEHADGHDGVILSAMLAIVLQPEFDPAGQTAPLGFGAGGAGLLAGKREADDVRVRPLRQVHREAAPAAADVEHPGAGRQAQLMADVFALGDLGRLQRHVGLAEVGAGVVHVPIEKGAEQRLVQIVVVAHVVEARAHGVPRVHERPHRPQHGGEAAVGDVGFEVGPQDGEQVDEFAVLDVPTLVHVGLAEVRRRIQEDLAHRSRLADDPGGFRCAVAERLALPVRCDEGQRPVALVLL